MMYQQFCHQNEQYLEKSNLISTNSNFLYFLKKLKSFVLIKDFEGFFRFLCLIIMGIFIFFIKPMLEFREYAHKNNIFVIPWSYNLVSIAAALVLCLGKRYINKNFHTFVMERLNDKYVGIQREQRAKKILKWTYDTLYYSTTTAFSIWAFKDADWMPWYFGGEGQCSNLFKDYPQFPDGKGNEYLLLYHLIQFGNHLFSFFELVLVRRNEELKFYEYTLHHFMAAGLIFYSGNFNFLYVSAIVLILHDMGDIIVAGGRGYCEMKFRSKYLLYMIVVSALFVWICTRLIIFPTCVIYTCWINAGNLIQWDVIKYCYWYQFIQLIILYGMHLYWTLFMLKIGVGFLLKPKYNNIYDNKDFKNINFNKKQN